jgi:hypothetical protein
LFSQQRVNERFVHIASAQATIIELNGKRERLTRNSATRRDEVRTSGSGSLAVCSNPMIEPRIRTKQIRTETAVRVHNTSETWLETSITLEHLLIFPFFVLGKQLKKTEILLRAQHLTRG